MHVIKPMALGLGTRPVEFRQRFGLAISGQLFVPFAQGPHGALWTEASMWKFLGREMALPLIDEGVPKIGAEFLVHGHAYPTGERRDEVAVRARLGACGKTLRVYGDRHWVGANASPPQPFERMPLTWDRAYGGPGFAANPLGIGHAPEGELHRLPNVEDERHRLQRPDLPVEPGGFGALEVVHPQRAALRGTYDDAWLKTHAPGFPPDIDWHHFNMAPRDQWFDAPLAGDEPFEFDHLHPTQPRLAGRLPGLRVRAFASYRADGAVAGALGLREVPMRLTTAWFFPHAECMVLVFHGLAETAHDDAADILRLIGAVERLGQARDALHYHDAMSRRLDVRTAAIHALNDAELLPDGVDLNDPEAERGQAVLRPDGLKEDAQYRRAQVDMAMARDQVRAMGKDPDAMGLVMPPREKPPTPAELPTYIQKVMAEADKQKWAIVADAVTHAENALALMRQAKVDPATLVHRGPPAFRAERELAEVVRGFAAAGAPLTDARRADLAAQFAKQQFMHHMDYLRNAHHQPPSPTLEGPAAAACRSEVKWMLKRGLKQWPTIDLTGADLSGLDLSGLDLTGAWLESARLHGTRLRGTRLRGAVLAHADFAGADCSEADFTGANLGRARLGEGIFDDADFTQAVLSHAQLARTRFIRARLSATDLLDAQWGEADWRGLRGQSLLLYQRDLKGVDLGKARLRQCSFIECDATGVDFSGARMAGCTFVKCRLEGARFVEARMPGTVFVDGTALARADFTKAVLTDANLGDCDASRARFDGARLDGANLGRAVLTATHWHGASAQRALLRKARLDHAVLAGANLMDAILQGADLRSADLRGANLYGADMARVQMDRLTRLHEANVDRARTWPRLPVAPTA